jgi:large subunit ribosomal protein L25
MAEALSVQTRDTHGKRHCKRLRRQGLVPAVLYGHGESNVSLAVSHDELAAVLRHGGRLVDLKGGVNETALIHKLQWDTYGADVLHVDFTRVSADERIEVTLPIELRGEAPGVKEGGVVQHLLHDVGIECPATSIPDKLVVNVNHLNLGGTITLAQVPLPEGARLLAEPEEVVVQCVEPAAEAVEAAAPEAAEPEVIGRKAEEEEEGE